MDIKEYISSGIIELYAAGALSETEASEVEAMALKYPEVKAELEAVQDAMISYSGSFKKNPDPQMRSRILDKIYEIEGTVRSENVIELKQHSVSADTGLNQYNRTHKYNYLMAAVWIFLVLNIAGNIYFFTKLKNTEEQMTSVVNENNRMKTEYEKIRLDMEKKSADMKMVMNRTNKIVDMKGMEISPASFATVYWNPNNKKVMLNVESLPEPPKNMQYQLWALKDGKPVDAGVFNMTGDMHMMPVQINDADAFAVTLEKMGGSPVPTLERLYVMGKI